MRLLGSQMKFSHFGGREDGQTVAEYAVIVAAVAVLLIVAALFFAVRVGGALDGGGESTQATFRPPVAQCDSNYSGGCVPAHPPDVDCGDLRRLGIEQVTVVGSDPHRLDPDGDGVGCG